MTLDGHPVGMTLTRIEIPTIDEMRNGMGTIHLRAAGSIEAGAGRHRLSVFNNHRPDTSVYMVNALVPDDSGVDIVSQSRDPRQQALSGRSSHSDPALDAQLLWLGSVWRGLAGVWVASEVRKNEKAKNA